MTDMISCEEVFENDPQARAEFDAVCDEWQDDAIKAQIAEHRREAAGDPRSWRGGFDAAENAQLARDGKRLAECEGCGEQWYADESAGATISSCRKCYKNDPYYC
jgi:hypothetical protein|tara:strand:+ start:2331 stop:2645 length:315 start_codon:yes stop_codon:yes gene_type:complete